MTNKIVGSPACNDNDDYCYVEGQKERLVSLS